LTIDFTHTYFDSRAHDVFFQEVGPREGQNFRSNHSFEADGCVGDKLKKKLDQQYVGALGIG